MTQSRSYRIGEVARQTGVSVETLRYYEKRGLLDAPARTEGGFRQYSDDVVHLVRFIKQAQSFGLTLDDIQQFVIHQQHRHHRPSCRKVRDLLTHRIDEIEDRINELREFGATLRGHLALCESALERTVEPSCPTLDSLDGSTRISKAHEAR